MRSRSSNKGRLGSVGRRLNVKAALTWHHTFLFLLQVFAVRRFISLALAQSEQATVNLVIADQWLVGKKISNGAFGQLRIGHDIEKVTKVFF